MGLRDDIPESDVSPQYQSSGMPHDLWFLLNVQWLVYVSSIESLQRFHVYKSISIFQFIQKKLISVKILMKPKIL